MLAREKMFGLIKSHQSIIDEYELTIKHNFEIKQGVNADLVFFKGNRKLLVLNYIDSFSADLPKVQWVSMLDFCETGFDFWCLYDAHYFHLAYVQVHLAFDEHIIPFKTFLYRISCDTI